MYELCSFLACDKMTVPKTEIFYKLTNIISTIKSIIGNLQSIHERIATLVWLSPVSFDFLHDFVAYICTMGLKI